MLGQMAPCGCSPWSHQTPLNVSTSGQWPEQLALAGRMLSSGCADPARCVWLIHGRGGAIDRQSVCDRQMTVRVCAHGSTQLMRSLMPTGRFACMAHIIRTRTALLTALTQRPCTMLGTCNCNALAGCTMRAFNPQSIECVRPTEGTVQHHSLRKNMMPCEFVPLW
jgi:hypothetical protein